MANKQRDMADSHTRLHVREERSGYIVANNDCSMNSILIFCSWIMSF